MEDLPTSLLTQQENAKSRTGEELETFGKYAASLYLNRKCGTLSEAVVETVKSAGLAPEQVRRVVEFTNTSAYLSKFASEGPGHKVINFDGGPASFPDVLRDLNDGGGGSLNDPAPSDYSLPPPDTSKLAARNLARLGMTDEKLASAFRVEEAVLPYENPMKDAEDLKDKLAGLYEEATHEISGLETRYMDLCDLLFQQVKQASLDGVPLGHLVAVMGTAQSEPEFMKAAFAMLTPRLIQNEVFSNEVGVASSLEKVAGAGLVNPAHPLVGVYDDFCDTLAKLAATRQVRDEIEAELGTVTTFMKAAAKGFIPKAWGVATNLAAQASKPVRKAVGAIGGETAGSLAGGLVEYSPHLLAALGAEEVYQRAKNNPAANAATNFVLGRVPYTHQNIMRQYNMQMGM